MGNDRASRPLACSGCWTTSNAGATRLNRGNVGILGRLDGAALAVERFLGKRSRRAGDFCPRRWRLGDRAVGHIALSAEVLGRGAEAALVVLLHAMLHLRNDQVGVVDCTLPHQYHNRHVRDAARLTGLDGPLPGSQALLRGRGGGGEGAVAFFPVPAPPGPAEYTSRGRS
jgi:hypothetical protein